jgi:phosphoribosylformylglycinamidine cyclo-ligase
MTATKNAMPQNNAYKEAGVDIEAGNALVDRIKPSVARTKRSGQMSNIGGFGALFDVKEVGYKDPLLVSATDGVGTKLKIAIEMNKYDTVGIDLVAMCVNDLVVQGAEPLFFLDYFACGALDVDRAATVIDGIATGCEQAGCALIGGETAEMPGMYAKDDFDLAGFAVGAVERNAVLTGDRVKEGDTILGLASNGIHSNGFSLVRKIVTGTQGQAYDRPASFDSSRLLGEILLDPTRIYVKPLLAGLRQEGTTGAPLISGLAHITGGGLLENIPRILPDGLGAELDAHNWTKPAVFDWLREAGGLTAHDMALTLNCGIGMAVICDSNDAETLSKLLVEEGETVFHIGKVVSSPETKADARVHIENL